MTKKTKEEVKWNNKKELIIQRRKEEKTNKQNQTGQVKNKKKIV